MYIDTYPRAYIYILRPVHNGRLACKGVMINYSLKIITVEIDRLVVDLNTMLHFIKLGDEPVLTQRWRHLFQILMYI